MNHHFVPDRSMGDDIGSLFLPTSIHLKSMVSDNELIELLWSNGHVVMHNQTHRRPPVTVTGFNQSQKSEQPTKGGLSLGNSKNLTLGNETVSWSQYSLGDSLEKKLCTEFLSVLWTVDATVDDKINKNAPADKGILSKSVFEQSDHLNKKAMPPPKSHGIGSVRRAHGLGNDDIVKFSQFSKPLTTDLVSSSGQFGQGSMNGIQVGLGETSSTSVCGSNQVSILISENQTLDDAKDSSRRCVNEDSKERPHEGTQTNTCGTTLTSSGGSGCSFGVTGHMIYSNQKHKRKGRDCEEPEYYSEESKYRFGEANKTGQQSASAYRSRASEVHNLSERSDKASILDEAIKYLKSLQLQVQMMWMGSGIAPIMFPGIQQYMSSIGMGMAQSPMPYMHTPSPLPRVPLVNQFMPSATIANYTPMCPPSALSQVNFPPQTQNVHLPEPQAQYLGFHRMQPSPQAVNLFTLGSQGLLPNQPSLEEPVIEKIQNGTPG